ncbi:hypothetical protein M9H77_21003 [Catharanthus roseus]|uniref:Uncharacterized protein n=1 Tax=Catharanthus roseus TaxID=4058 RepID=A0ACC0AMT3_CATRO|nr:hypothetical protein M9H77_21003 [Catharanthus roseus]
MSSHFCVAPPSSSSSPAPSHLSSRLIDTSSFDSPQGAFAGFEVSIQMDVSAEEGIANPKTKGNGQWAKRRPQLMGEGGVGPSYLVVMNIEWWNVRGFSNTLKHKEVNRFLKDNNIAVFALLEKKLEEGKLFDIVTANLKIGRSNFKQPWLVLGDFNSILNGDERHGQSSVSSYEARDFKNSYVDLGLKPLKELNRKHFIHISSKAEAAKEELKQVQIVLHDAPDDLNLKTAVRSLQSRAVFPCESERKFLAQKTNNAKVSWATLCLGKQHGGLGLRDTRKWNDALLSKALWNIHAKKDTLWYRRERRRKTPHHFSRGCWPSETAWFKPRALLQGQLRRYQRDFEEATL